MKQYIVDAFTDTPFTGNPAAVCVMDHWPHQQAMMKLAMENNLSETAFLVKEGNRYRLRWFTPVTEVELCGHATLASAYVILTYYEPDWDQVPFETVSGILTVKRQKDLYAMDFPTMPLKDIPVTDAMEEAFGIRPIRAVLGMDLICVFEKEEQVKQMQPDFDKLTMIEGRIQNATAQGCHVDCVSRSFAPKLGIHEDPVCGSAHCQIASYWAEKLKKKQITAFQASTRTGTLYCHIREKGRITICGQAVPVSINELLIDLG